MRLNLFIAFVLLTFYVNAKTVVKGHILGVDGSSYGNKHFAIEVVEDFITFKKTRLVSGVSGKHGDFSVEVNLNATSFLFISFDKVQRTFYAEPDKYYYIDITVPIEGLSNKGKVLSKNISSAKIVNSHKTELNYLIDTLDYACSKFLQKNIAKRKDANAVALFIETLRAESEYVFVKILDIRYSLVFGCEYIFNHDDGFGS